MAGIYIFAGILVVAVAVFTFYKLKWNRADRQEEQRNNLAFQEEIAEEQRKRQAKIQP